MTMDLMSSHTCSGGCLSELALPLLMYGVALSRYLSDDTSRGPLDDTNPSEGMLKSVIVSITRTHSFDSIMWLVVLAVSIIGPQTSSYAATSSVNRVDWYRNRHGG